MSSSSSKLDNPFPSYTPLILYKDIIGIIDLTHSHATYICTQYNDNPLLLKKHNDVYAAIMDQSQYDKNVQVSVDYFSNIQELMNLSISVYADADNHSFNSFINYINALFNYIDSLLPSMLNALLDIEISFIKSHQISSSSLNEKLFECKKYIASNILLLNINATHNKHNKTATSYDVHLQHNGICAYFASIMQLFKLYVVPSYLSDIPLDGNNNEKKQQENKRNNKPIKGAPNIAKIQHNSNGDMKSVDNNAMEFESLGIVDMSNGNSVDDSKSDNDKVVKDNINSDDSVNNIKLNFTPQMKEIILLYYERLNDKLLLHSISRNDNVMNVINDTKLYCSYNKFIGYHDSIFKNLTLTYVSNNKPFENMHYHLCEKLYNYVSKCSYISYGTATPYYTGIDILIKNITLPHTIYKIIINKFRKLNSLLKREYNKINNISELEEESPSVYMYDKNYLSSPYKPNQFKNILDESNINDSYHTKYILTDSEICVFKDLYFSLSLLKSLLSNNKSYFTFKPAGYYSDITAFIVETIFFLNKATIISSPEKGQLSLSQSSNSMLYHEQIIKFSLLPLLSHIPANYSYSLNDHFLILHDILLKNYICNKNEYLNIQSWSSTIYGHLVGNLPKQYNNQIHLTNIIKIYADQIVQSPLFQSASVLNETISTDIIVPDHSILNYEVLFTERIYSSCRLFDDNNFGTAELAYVTDIALPPLFKLFECSFTNNSLSGISEVMWCIAKNIDAFNADQFHPFLHGFINQLNNAYSIALKCSPLESKTFLKQVEEADRLTSVERNELIQQVLDHVTLTKNIFYAWEYIIKSYSSDKYINQTFDYIVSSLLMPIKSFTTCYYFNVLVSFISSFSKDGVNMEYIDSVKAAFHIQALIFRRFRNLLKQNNLFYVMMYDLSSELLQYNQSFCVVEYLELVSYIPHLYYNFDSNIASSTLAGTSNNSSASLLATLTCDQIKDLKKLLELIKRVYVVVYNASSIEGNNAYIFNYLSKLFSSISTCIKYFGILVIETDTDTTSYKTDTLYEMVINTLMYACNDITPIPHQKYDASYNYTKQQFASIFDDSNEERDDAEFERVMLRQLFYRCIDIFKAFLLLKGGNAVSLDERYYVILSTIAKKCSVDSNDGIALCALASASINFPLELKNEYLDLVIPSIGNKICRRPVDSFVISELAGDYMIHLAHDEKYNIYICDWVFDICKYSCEVIQHLREPNISSTMYDAEFANDSCILALSKYFLTCSHLGEQHADIDGFNIKVFRVYMNLFSPRTPLCNLEGVNIIYAALIKLFNTWSNHNTYKHEICIDPVGDRMIDAFLMLLLSPNSIYINYKLKEFVGKSLLKLKAQYPIIYDENIQGIGEEAAAVVQQYLN